MKQSASALLILSLIILTSTGQTTTCPQNVNKDQIQTGLIQFGNTQHRQSCKQVQIRFIILNNQLQVAASVINVLNYYVANGVDYAIKVGANIRNTSFTATLLSDHSGNWTSITVSYIAASRSDMLMGSFLVDSYQTLKCQQNVQSTDKNTIQVSSVVREWSGQFLKSRPIIFISGIKTISSSIDSIKISKVEVNSSGILNIVVQSSHGLELQFIQLSYVMVSSSFQYEYGYELNYSEYSFPISQEFNSNNLIQIRWGVYTGSLICQGKQCQKQCVSKNQCANLKGNQNNQYCIICQKGKIWDGQKCISICDMNQLWNGSECVCQSKAIRVKTQCILCGSNSSPDKPQKECVCNQGYIFNSWKSGCVSYSCPLNSQPKVTQLGVQCVCKSGFYKAYDACKTIPNCPLNSIFDVNSQKCVCTIQGQFMSNGMCISCANKNQYFDQILKKCQCRPNLILVGGNCVACPSFSTLNKQKTNCLCNQGYIWSEWKVACVSYKCPLNSMPFVNENGVKCVCKNGFYVNGSICQAVPNCKNGTMFDVSKKVCLCEKKNNYLIKEVCLECPINSAWNGTQCVCNAGYIEYAGVCAFVCGKNQILQNGKCVCTAKSILFNKVCQQCPLNSAPNKQKTLCNCNEGFRYDDFSKCCTKVTCPQNSSPKFKNYTTICVCNQGFMPQNNLCTKIVRCPLNSIWSQDKLCCQCVNLGQYMINSQCKKCGVNQIWNQKQRQCVCVNGFNMINGECRICEINEVFSGVKCECSLGYYRNGLKCEACHASCGTCSGPNNNQCLICSDVTLNFRSGACLKDTACPKGLYQHGSTCAPCSTYCSDCKSQSICNTCIDGFQMQSLTYGGVSVSYCVQKCGDGRRFQLDCDDGNNKNGDGCTSDCKVQAGWTCTGGSSTKPSLCILGQPERTYLQLTGTVHLYGRIVQGVRLSYIPQALTANDCAQCYNLLWVRVLRSDIVPGVRVNYLPKSKYQFLVQFEFRGTFSIPNFNIALQINPAYAKYFSRKDMAQIQIRTIDPSVLAIKDKEQQLKLDDVADNKKPIKIPNTLVDELFN